MDVSEMVARYGYTYSAVTRLARRLYISCPKGGKYDFTPDQVEKIRRAYEKSMIKPAAVSTKDVAIRLNRCLTTIQTAGKAIGIVYRKAHPHDYTMEEIKRIEAILSELKVDRKKPEIKVTYKDKSWWVDPLPKCLQDDYEEEGNEI